MNEILNSVERELKQLQETLKRLASSEFSMRAGGHIGQALPSIAALKQKSSILDQLEVTETIKNDASKILKDYAQAVLDFTFIDEQRVVDRDFPKDERQRMHDIVSQLDKPFIFARSVASLVSIQSEISPNPAIELMVVNLLTIELVECLHWRKGALGFMFSATMIQQNRNEELEDDFLESSIKHLESMMEVRKKYDTSAQISPRVVKGRGGDEIEELTRNGVWSDSHLLALMYTGEMCYWRYSCWKGTAIENVEYKKKAIDVLSTYENLVTKFTSLKGWKADRAQQLLKELNSL